MSKPLNYQQLASSAQFDNQLASSLYSVGFILPGSWSTVGFITRDFHALISGQHSQTNRRRLHTLFLTSKSRCMPKIISVDALLTAQNVLSWSGRFGGGHTGWSQLQLASSVSPLWAAEPARPRGQSNDVRPRDQSTGPWSGSPQSQLSGYIFGSRQDTVVF